MIEKLSIFLATYLYNKSDTKAVSISIMSYSLEILIGKYLIIFGTIGVGLMTGHAWESCIAIVAFTTLRRYTGGWHLPTMDLCVLVSTALLLICAHIQFSNGVDLIMNMIAITIVLLLAPTKKSKQLGSLIIVIATIVSAPVITMTLFFQALTLISRKEVDTVKKIIEMVTNKLNVTAQQSVNYTEEIDPRKLFLGSPKAPKELKK